MSSSPQQKNPLHAASLEDGAGRERLSAAARDVDAVIEAIGTGYWQHQSGAEIIKGVALRR